MSEEKLEEINTIAEFMEKLNKVKDLEQYKNLEKGNEVIAKFSIDLFYRGHENNEYNLLPSIARISHDVNYAVNKVEYALINQAKNEYPILFSETDNPLDLLIKLQHYGIPTRLLDITSNPLVALYFACRTDSKQYGEIFVFGNQRKNYPIRKNIIYKLCRRDLFYKNKISITKFMKMVRANEGLFTNIEVKKYIETNNMKSHIEECIENINFIYPAKSFERLFLQQGYFILLLNDYAINGNSIEHTDNLSPIPKDHKNIIARYIIPAKSKKHLLDELKMLNITESTLFHDDVDRVCKNIVADFKGRYGNK